MLFLYNLSNDLFIMNFQLLAAKGVLNKLENKEVCGLIQYFQMFDHFGIKVVLSYCHMPTKLLRTWYTGSKKTKIDEGINLLIRDHSIITSSACFWLF